MRLVFVNSAWTESWGGGEKWTVEAAHWFSRRGHDTLVVGRPQSRLIKAAAERNLAVAETPFGGDFDPLAFQRAYKILQSFRADLAVVNFNKEAWQFGMAARASGIPVLARHGFPVMKGKLYHHLLLRLLSKVVVNAGSIRRHYAAEGLPVDRIDILHNGTAEIPQQAGALRKRFGIPESSRLVLGAGRLESQKRFDLFIEVAAALCADNADLRFLIAGDGPLRAELTARIEALGWTGRIQVVDFVPDLAALVSDASLFLLTSDNEGTPNVLLEAMTAGVPCISFDIGSVPDILTGPLSADCIPFGDTPAMIARARHLLANPLLLQAEAAFSRQRIHDDFSLTVSMERFERLFLSLCGTPS